MKTLYLDCFSGISGNMMIGALVNLGVDPATLERELQKLPLDGYRLEFTPSNKCGMSATHLEVRIDHPSGEGHQHDHHHEHEHPHDHHEHSHEHPHDHHHHEHDHQHDHHHVHEHHEPEHDHTHGPDHVHRNILDIEQMIEQSELSDRVKSLSRKIFSYVSRAESRIHGIPPEELHFHEVGAVDSIVDIVGSAICIDWIKPDRILSSHLHVGTGFVNCAHGKMPVPSPATAEILKDAKIPFYSTGIRSEMVTPTGAAIVAALAEGFGPFDQMTVTDIGYGAGTKDFPIPNILRVFLAIEEQGFEDSVIKCDFQVDDMTGEELGFLMEELLDVGVKEVFFTPIQMKKNRPATKVTVLVDRAREEACIDRIFRHSTTLGLQIQKVQRRVLEREERRIETEMGKVRKKIAYWKEESKEKLEYDDIKQIVKSL